MLRDARQLHKARFSSLACTVLEQQYYFRNCNKAADTPLWINSDMDLEMASAGRHSPSTSAKRLWGFKVAHLALHIRWSSAFGGKDFFVALVARFFFGDETCLEPASGRMFLDTFTLVWPDGTKRCCFFHHTHDLVLSYLQVAGSLPHGRTVDILVSYG